MIEFNDLWRGHPINESVQSPCIAPHNLTNMEGKQIRLGFPVFSNQCAIRMGVSLRRAGVQPSQLSGITHCAVHPRSDMHFINASQLANGIARAGISGVGPTEKYTAADAAQFYPKIFGRTGIIYIQDYWRRSHQFRSPHGRPHRRLERIPLLGEMADGVVLVARLLLELRRRG